MEAESVIASTTQFQTLLIAFVLIVAVIYFFIEMRRLDMKVSVIEANVKKMMNGNKNGPNMSPPNEGPQGVNQMRPMDQPPMDQPPMDQPRMETEEVDEINTQTTSQNVVEVEEALEEIIQPPNNVVETKENPIESMLSFSFSQSNIINSISEEIASAAETMVNQPAETMVNQPAETMVNQPAEITIITKDTSSLPISTETTIEEIRDIKSVDEGEEDKKDIDGESITMDRIDDITEEENDTLSIDDPILETDNEQPLLTEITAYTEYQNHTIKELKDILTEMKLPTSGNKTKLIQRIVSNKNKISN